MASLSDKTVIAARKIYREDSSLTVADLAERFKVPASTLNKAIVGTTFAHLNGRYPPHKRVSNRIMDEDVIAVRQRMREGEVVDLVATAETLGVTPRTLRLAVTGERYTHLNEMYPPVAIDDPKNAKKETATRMYQEGKSFRQIEAELGIAKSTLSGWLSSIVRKPVRKPSAEPNTKKVKPERNWAKHPYADHYISGFCKDGTINLVHPDTRKVTRMTYARYLMSVHLGRILTSEERVRHLHGKEDTIDNIELISHAETNCVTCGTPFKKRNAKNNACSRSCSAKYRGKLLSKPTVKNRISCPGCKTLFTKSTLNRKYCSESCKDKERYRRRNIARRNPFSNLDVPVTIIRRPRLYTNECVVCEQEFETSKKNEEVCSNSDCRRVIHEGEMHNA